jgi:hypothetical protein
MDKKLDVEKVRSALKRAATAAASGSQDKRAGRYVGRDTATGQFKDKAVSGKTFSDRKPK